MQFTTFKEAAEYVGGFSEPSKMPCYAYSIPAQECKVGSILRETAGSVCAKCYARKGRYVFANVKNALYRRFSTLDKPFWVEAMAFAIKEKAMKFFRFHDAGDIQSVEHLSKICKIAALCPDCRFWLPTRETGIVAEYLDNGGIVPANLNIRISGSMIDGPAPVGMARKFDLCVSSVSSNMESVNCHSFRNEGKCGDCRACWDKSVFEIVYKSH